MAEQLPLIVFDVNETLLDLEAITPIFKRIFGDGSVMRLWFADLILYSEALTLAGIEVQTRQLEHGRIVDKFERRFSVDKAGHHKPSREAYAYVEAQLGTKPSDMLLIASHTWDTIGALGAGWHAALIKRSGNDILGVGPQPDVVGTDLNDVDDRLIERYVGVGAVGGVRTW